jgi:hypothetical protein
MSDEWPMGLCAYCGKEHPIKRFEWKGFPAQTCPNLPKTPTAEAQALFIKTLGLELPDEDGST